MFYKLCGGVDDSYFKGKFVSLKLFWNEIVIFAYGRSST